MPCGWPLSLWTCAPAPRRPWPAWFKCSVQRVRIHGRRPDVAPWIGTALGGPLGGMAVEAATNALGLGEKTVDAVKQAIAGVTPEQMLALKTAD